MYPAVEVSYHDGDPEGVLDGEIGAIVVDQNNGDRYKKTSVAGTRTGWVSDTGGGSTTFAGLSDKATADLPSINTPLATALGLKATIASPTFTGTPAAPTPSGGDNTTKLATTAFVAAAVAALINSAPSALDTLKELADAMGDDANFAATMTTALADKLGLAGGTLTGPLILETGIMAGSAAVRIGASGHSDYSSLQDAINAGKYYCIIEPVAEPGDATLPDGATLVLLGYGVAVSQVGTITCSGSATIIGNGAQMISTAGVQANPGCTISLSALNVNYAEAVGATGAPGAPGSNAGEIIATNCVFNDTIYLYGGNGGAGTVPATPSVVQFLYNGGFMTPGSLTLDGNSSGDIPMDGDGNPIWPDMSGFGWTLTSSTSSAATYTSTATGPGHSATGDGEVVTVLAFADGTLTSGGGNGGNGGTMTINNCVVGNPPTLIGGIGTDGGSNGSAGFIGGAFNFMGLPDAFSGGQIFASVINGNFYSSYD